MKHSSKTTSGGRGPSNSVFFPGTGIFPTRPAARILAELEAPLEQIILGHLSRDCNSPNLALDCAISQVLARNSRSGAQASIHCACQQAPGPILRIIQDALKDSSRGADLRLPR